MKKISPLAVFCAFVLCVAGWLSPALAGDQERYVPGTILLKTNWSQKYPFNKFLPKISGERVVAGCVNVALAQLMRYYQYPLNGNGVIHHIWRGRSLSATLGHRYNWKDIPEKITSLSPVFQIDEIASLIRELGIINKTEFNAGSGGGSGASINYRAIIKRFKYSNRVKSASNKDPDFFNIITNEIKRRRPVLLEISGYPMGHMAVIDGFKDSQKVRLFHVNMGWGGKENGFYDLRRVIELKSSAEDDYLSSDYRFSNKLRVFYNFVPCGEDDCYVNLEKGDEIRGHKIRGYFDRDRDEDSYRGLYLRGPTIIKGDLGFSNLGFYINIYDSNGWRVASASPKSKSFRIDLEPGRYDVEATQCATKDKRINCFQYSRESSKYEIDINSGRVGRKLKAAIDEKDDETFIKNRFSDLILDYEYEYKIRVDAYNRAGKSVEIKAESDDKSILKTRVKGNQLILIPVNPERDSTTRVVVKASSGQSIAEKDFHVLFNPGSVYFGKEFEVNGRFKSQAGVSRRKVILDGVCSVSGNNGYKNQAFFITLKNIAGKTLVSGSSKPIVKRFKRDLYFVESSLQRRRTIKKGKRKTVRTKTFKYKKDFGNIYNVNVVCPDFREGLSLLMGDNRDLPPKIVSELPDRIVNYKFKRLEIPIETDDKDGERAKLEADIEHKTLEGKIIGHTLVLKADRVEKNSLAEITVTAKSNNYQHKKSFKIFFASEDFPFGENFELKGRFKNQDDYNLFKVALSGKCSIAGDNGYISQAFYIQVLNHKRRPWLKMTNKPFKYDFPAGIYYIRASLRSDSRSYYRFIPKKGDKYKITFRCPEMKSVNKGIEKVLRKN